MPEYAIYQVIVSAIAILYLYMKSRRVAREGSSTLPEMVQIAMWFLALVLGLSLPERIGPFPPFFYALLVIIVVTTKLNLWRVQKERAEAEKNDSDIGESGHL